MKKLLFIFFGFFALILTIWLLSSWQVSNWQKKFSETTGLQPSGEVSYSPTKEGYEEFISSDGKLKMDYPANWLVLKESQFLEMAVPPDWKEEYNLKTIFLAQYFEAEKFAQLIVYQGDFDISIEEIIEKMFDTNREQGWQVEIIESEIEEGQGIFEAKYIVPDSYSLHSKEKIIKEGEENTYLISFITLDKNWDNFVEETDLIINSAREFYSKMQHSDY